LSEPILAIQLIVHHNMLPTF